MSGRFVLPSPFTFGLLVVAPFLWFLSLLLGQIHAVGLGHNNGKRNVDTD